MAEKNILAYFHSPEEAQAVQRRLQALRALDTQVDRIDGYPGDGIDHQMNPITGDIPSLGALTLSGDFSNKSAAILSASSVSASGMSDGGQQTVTGRDILLTAVMPEETYDQALRVVQEAGGQL